MSTSQVESVALGREESSLPNPYSKYDDLVSNKGCDRRRSKGEWGGFRTKEERGSLRFNEGGDGLRTKEGGDGLRSNKGGDGLGMGDDDGVDGDGFLFLVL